MSATEVGAAWVSEGMPPSNVPSDPPYSSLTVLTSRRATAELLRRGERDETDTGEARCDLPLGGDVARLLRELGVAGHGAVMGCGAL